MKNITRALLIALCLLGQGVFAQGPPAPVLVSPEDMTYIPKNVDFQFKWKTVAGAKEYRFWWSGDGINWQSVTNAGNALSWRLTENYPAGVPFRWKVQARVGGQYSPDSAVRRVYDVPGTVPNLTGPADLSYIPAGNTAWTYTWGAVAGAAEYELQESTDGGTIWTKRTVATNSAAAPAGGLGSSFTAAAPFYWKVRAKIGSQYTGFSAVRRIYTVTPAAPTLLYPADISYTRRDTTISYRWSPVPGATGYRFQWSKNGGVSWDSTTVATNSILGDSLAGAFVVTAPVRWRVKALLGGTFATLYSAEFHLYTVVVAPPTLTAPADLAYVVPSLAFTYSWNAVPGATGYYLERNGVVDTLSAATTSVVVSAGLPATIANTAPLKWRVRAVIGSGYTGWSVVRRLFTIVPSAPTTMAPANYTYVPKNTAYRFSWTAVPGAKQYKIQWAKRGFAPTTDTSASNTKLLTMTVDAKVDSAIWWRVQAELDLTHATAFTDTSTAHLFTVPLVPSLVSPVDMSFVAPGDSVNYVWNAVPVATKYKLQTSLNGTTWTDLDSVNAPAASKKLLMPLSASYTTVSPLSWRVLAFVGNQYSSPSVRKRLYTILPAAPTLSSPADLSLLPRSARVPYRWMAVPGADRYELQGSTNGGASWATIKDTTSTAVMGDSLSFNYTVASPFLWRVRARIGGVYRAWSSAGKIYTVPLVVTLTTPLDLYYTPRTTGWTYTWGAVTAASSYQLQTSTDGGATWATVKDTTATSAPGPALGVDLTAANPFLWRVRAKVGSQYTSWSVPWRVYTVIPAAPTLVTPPDLSFVLPADSVSYRWSSVPEATQYELEKKQGNAGSWVALATVSTNSVLKLGSLGSTYSVLNPYSWHVRAKVGTAYTDWSATGRIYTITPAATLDSGLVLFYTFNGNTNDQSPLGGGPNATIHGATVASGRLGSSNTAYQFDGTSSYISMDGALSGPAKTIAFWAKTDTVITASTTRRIMGNDTDSTGVIFGPYASVAANEIISLTTGPGKALIWNNNTLPAGIDTLGWKQYVFQWDGSSPYGYHLFIDGIERGFSDTTLGTAPTASSYLSAVQWNIGRYGATASNGWWGAIDEVKIWNRSLSSAEITSLYSLAAKPVAQERESASLGSILAGPALVASQNAPNPFNPSTTIEYTLGQDAQVIVTIYNMIGHKVAVLQDEHLPAGTHAVKWDASNVASGVYFYRIQAGVYTETRKMLLFK